MSLKLRLFVIKLKQAEVYKKIGDELIISGGGNPGTLPSGVCWSDDDCSSLPSLNPFGTDDLITLSVTGDPKSGSQNSIQNPGAISSTPNSLIPLSSRSPFHRDCDDEDEIGCEAGSGDEGFNPDKDGGKGIRNWDSEKDENFPNVGSSAISSTSNPWPTSVSFSFPSPTPFPSLSFPSSPTKSYPIDSFYSTFHSSTTEDSSQILYTSKPIPPEEDPVSPSTVESTEQKHRPKMFRPPLPPAIVDVPKRPKPLSKESNSGVSNSGAPNSGVSNSGISNSGVSTPPTPTHVAPDRTALLIGLITILIIVIVVIAPLFLYVRIKYKDSLNVVNGHALLGGQALLNGNSKRAPPGGYQLVSVPGPNGTAVMATMDGRMVGVHHVQGTLQHVNVSTMDPVRAVGLGTCGPPTLKRKKDEWYV